ncbi:MAG TPA: alpha/beta fold hydrolase [Candidatus Baltobacteraceae bacterium]|nr:alpha/beta fold hydrolase [Candidatus Baltobacteraceae bacterium]
MKTALPPLLLLPGLACDGGVWRHEAQALGEITEVRIADYGASDSIAGMARAALESAPERFAVAGHSMGGRVAMEIVRSAPQRVAGLALLNTAYKAWAPGEAGEREKAERMGYVEIAQTQGMRAMARQWLQKMVYPSRLADTPLIESIVDMLGRKTPDVFVGQIKALLARPDATAVLAGVKVPTLIMTGREDAWSVLETHREMAALTPNSKLVIVERCGHMAPMERPEEITAALKQWLEWTAGVPRGATRAAGPAVDAKV